MVKMGEKACIYYSIVHVTDVRKVLAQIEVSANEGRPDELCDLNQQEYNELVNLMRKYFAMIQRIK